MYTPVIDLFYLGRNIITEVGIEQMIMSYVGYIIGKIKYS